MVFKDTSALDDEIDKLCRTKKFPLNSFSQSNSSTLKPSLKNAYKQLGPELIEKCSLGHTQLPRTAASQDDLWTTYHSDLFQNSEPPHDTLATLDCLAW